jgi:hypothetical protein
MSGVEEAHRRDEADGHRESATRTAHLLDGRHDVHRVASGAAAGIDVESSAGRSKLSAGLGNVPLRTSSAYRVTASRIVSASEV